jgi:hypothetical protein
LPQRISIAEQLSHGRQAEHAHLCALLDIRRVEHAPRSEIPGVERRKMRDAAISGRWALLAIVAHARDAPSDGQHRGRARRLTFDCADVRVGERRWGPVARVRNGRHLDEIRSERLELRQNGSTRAFSEAQHRDERADADGESEHGERAAPGLAEHDLQREPRRVIAMKHRRPRYD